MDRIKEFLFTKYKAKPVVDEETLMKQKIAQWKQKLAQQKQKEEQATNVNPRILANKNSQNRPQRLYSGNRQKVANSVPASIKEESYDSSTFSKALKGNIKKQNIKEISNSSESDDSGKYDDESALNEAIRSESESEKSDTESESSKTKKLKDDTKKKYGKFRRRRRFYRK